ncbi:CPBP family intramembrane glutamic endopeptidase [Acidobacteriota bacterium]
MDETTELKGLGARKSLYIFGIAGFVFYLETYFLIPWLSKTTGIETVVFWFLVAGLGMFLPLLIVANLMLRSEGAFNKPGLVSGRLRFKKIRLHDWLWIFGAILAIGCLCMLVMKLLEMISGPFNQQPPFMQFEPLSSGRYWILLAWFPYWILNIMGEEILWRGVIFPRQEIVFGRYTWIFHGFCWSLFHIPFGWQLFLTMLPILFIQSLAVQKTKNTWAGILIHAVINGPSFIAISLGLL